MKAETVSFRVIGFGQISEKRGNTTKYKEAEQNRGEKKIETK